jgi:hypothetical protein
MTKITKIKSEVNDIQNRIDEIYKILDIYNISDADSINSIKEELKTYADRLKKITDEELK